MIKKILLPDIFLGIWIIAMISLPIVKWTIGESALHIGITIGVIMQVLTVLSFLVHHWGFKKALQVGLLVAFMGWAAEWIGSHTGFPFGSYEYTPLLQPQIAGVPLLIPLAWLMMLPPAWAVAKVWVAYLSIPPQFQKLLFVILSAVAFTAWDLFLDPQMVGWGFWKWHQPGLYFGIPLENYGGWLLVSGLISLWVGRTDIPSTPMLLIYAVTWILQTIGQFFFWQQPGPALVGFIAMGIMLIPLKSSIFSLVQRERQTRSLRD